MVVAAPPLACKVVQKEMEKLMGFIFVLFPDLKCFFKHF